MMSKSSRHLSRRTGNFLRCLIVVLAASMLFSVAGFMQSRGRSAGRESAKQTAAAPLFVGQKEDCKYCASLNGAGAGATSFEPPALFDQRSPSSTLATVTFGTAGSFNGGGSFIIFGGGGNTLTLTFNGVPAGTTVNANPTVSTSFGTITSSVTGTGATITPGTSFGLAISQSVPSPGTGNLSATLSGSISASTSTGVITFSVTTATINGRIKYDIVNSTMSLADPGTNSGVTDIQGQVTSLISSATSGNWSNGATWGGAGIPSNTDNVFIQSGHTVTIDTPSNAANLTVQNGGILQFETNTARTLTVGAAVAINAGGTFRSNPTGTQTGHLLSVGTDLTNNGTLDFSTNGNTAAAGITFIGAANNTFGVAGPTTNIRTLTIDKGAGNANSLSIAGGDLVLSSAAAALTLTNGRVVTGANTLILSSATANVTRTNGYVEGNFRKNFSALGSKSFEVGTANGFSPVTVNVTAGSLPADFIVKAVQGPQPNIGTPALALQRYWTLTATGVTADLTFNYLDPTDVSGNEAAYVIFRYNGVFSRPGGSVNTSTNTATITGVTSFASDWTLGEPAAVVGPPLGNYANTGVQLGANTTITPDAAPTGVERLTVATSTNFKGKLEGRPTTGVVRVTDAHPAGAYTVAVTAFDSGGLTTTKTFTLTVTTPATCNPVSFAAATNFGAGNNPISVAVGDFNDDGKQDLAITNFNSHDVSILLGSGAGSFSGPTNFAVGGDAFSVAVGDFNGDGNEDLAVTLHDSNNVSVLLGNGVGSFGGAANFNVGSTPLSVAVGDFNGDRKQDLAVANGNSDNVSVLLGDGAGSFGAATNFAAGDSPESVVVGDFNDDGKQDLATANFNTGSVSVLLGNGAGSFPTLNNFSAGSNPRSLAIGDFNSDGKQDIVTANSSVDNVSVLFGNGTGGFAAATNFPADDFPLSIAVGDFNGDGNQDLAVANNTSNDVSVLLGNGAGSFSAATNLATGNSPFLVAVGDFNGDGKQDLAVANSNSNNVSVLLRQCPAATTFTVTNTNNGGAGSLRQAILDANANAGQTDTIGFNIPGAGVHTISPTSALPTITDPVIIDGYTQPGASANTLTSGDDAVLLIELNGTSAGATANGLSITAGNSTVRGLAINRFGPGGASGGAGVQLQTGGGNVVEGCFIGITPAGTAAPNNFDGVSISASNNNRIGGAAASQRNIISGNTRFGVFAVNASTNNTIVGNFIGTNVAGNAAIANSIGVLLSGDSPNNTIGGVIAGTGNVVSGNTSNGVFLGSGGNLVQGNLVGTTAAGTAALGNGASGVAVVGSSNNTIGGATPAARNVVSGNAGDGVEISDSSAVNNTVAGNFIGTTSAGTASLPNTGHGVEIAGGSNNTVGGTAAGAANLIANNAGAGVLVSTGSGNSVLANQIFSNGGLGIDLAPAGVNANDAGDGDTGSNTLQNFPVLIAANSAGASTLVLGALNSTANTTFRLEFFSNPTCDVSGNGEGQTFLGSTLVTTDGGGNANINANLASATGVGQAVTATATDPSGNTSEFSACRQVTAPANFSISGRVVDNSANPLSGVAMTLAGGASASTFTDVSGNYSFLNLVSGGNYTVTPSRNNYSFSPIDQTFNNLNLNRFANFVGTQTISITGRVTTANDLPFNNVTVALTKNGVAVASMQTDPSGNYSFPNLTAGENYVVTPVGTFAPSGLTFSNLTVNVNANFKSQCSTVGFAATTNFAVGLSPKAVAVGDFNGDGKLDLVTANQTSDNLSLLPGNGAGGFAASTTFAVGTGPVSVAVGDFNGDGKLDLVAAKFAAGNVSLLLGNGAGNFAAPTNFSAGTNPDSVAVADFNGDLKLDIAVSNLSSNNVSLLLNNGAGGFVAATNFAVGVAPQSVTVGDFNKDGKPDLVTANLNSGNVSVLLGTGGGGFVPATNFAAGSGPVAVAVGDFNSDGRPDMAVANDNSDNVSVLLGDGGGGFAPAITFQLNPGSSPLAIALGDFNGDGKADLALANANSNNVSVLLGDGNGNFPASTIFAVGSVPTSVAAADFNGDGKLDLGVTNQNNNNVSVLLNNSGTCTTQTAVTISGQVTDANNSPLPDVTVRLSGTVTRVVLTDINGNYSFANLPPGGSYSVTIQSPYFVFSPSRSDFFILNTNPTVNLVAAPSAVPPPMPSLSDDFSSPLRDPNKWNLGTLTLPSGAFDPRVTAVQGGRLVITPLTQAAGLHYGGYASAHSVDMRNAVASVELFAAAGGGADTIFGIGLDTDNYFRFLVHTAGAANNLTPAKTPGSDIEAPLATTAAQLLLQVKFNGQLNALNIDYDPVLHHFIRFRHEPLTNSIVFETSSDVDFCTITFQRRVILDRTVFPPGITLDKALSAMTVELTAGTSGPTTPSPAEFDNLAVVAGTVQFSADRYTVVKGVSSASITVTRTGSTATAASVDVTTSNSNTVGRLNFATGETSKTFSVPIAQSDQTVKLRLLNPLGTGLNSPASALLSVIDPPSAVSNPLDDASFFVTQQYLDFLDRKPDPDGLAFWTTPIADCRDPVSCNNARVNVSLAFFSAKEFQETGSFVYRLFKGALLREPTYAEFVAERAKVVGGPDLEANKRALLNEFVQRSAFTQCYSCLLIDGPFLEALLRKTTLTLTSDERAMTVGKTRAEVLGIVIDSQASKAREYNPSFVLMQYFGYLRRDADPAGYAFWLDVLNNRTPNNYRSVVCAFTTSAEYQRRFSSIATHSNQECQ